MGSETSPEHHFPVVNFSKLQEGSGTPEWESVKSQVQDAVEEFGFFRAFFDEIPEEHQKEMLSGLEELFEQPLETKTLNLSRIPNGGYIGKTFFTPLYESIGIDEPGSLENIENVASVIWPQGQPSFSKSVHCFSNQMLELDKIVRKMMLESLKLEKYSDEMMDSASYSFRAQRYEGVRGNEKVVGLHSHMDNSAMTILFQNNKVDGLEIQTRDGEWIDQNFSPDEFVVVIGEGFHAWSNGRWYSPYHRVTMRGEEARYSVALFSGFKLNYIVKAPEELVDEEHPLLYKPFDFFEFLKLSRSGSNKKPYSPIKEYFGV